MIINPYMFNSVSYDPDAQAFFNATGITNTVQMNAVNQLVLSLKSNNIWQKFIAIYPYVGGTATTHKFNLVNPLDTNAAFRILWAGGVTHNANGVTGNGTNGYGETYIQPSTHLTQNSTHISFWSRTNSQNANREMGIADGALNASLGCVTRNTSNFSINTVNDNTGTVSANSDSTGFYIASRTASNSRKLYKNGAVLNNATTASTTRTTVTIPVLGQKSFNNTMGAYLAKNHSFASVGTGINDADALAFYNIVNTFNTALGR